MEENKRLLTELANVSEQLGYRKALVELEELVKLRIKEDNYKKKWYSAYSEKTMAWNMVMNDIGYLRTKI
jgi:hypothetical protein